MPAEDKEPVDFQSLSEKEMNDAFARRFAECRQIERVIHANAAEEAYILKLCPEVDGKQLRQMAALVEHSSPRSRMRERPKLSPAEEHAATRLHELRQEVREKQTALTILMEQ